MSKLRSVNTHFWSDNYVIDLDPTEKLLFLYLLTNTNTNMLGIYELHIKKISFDTGIDEDMVVKIFDRFESDGKASYIEGYVCLHNFTKHQSYNANMKISAVNSFNDLPLSIKESDFTEPLVKALKPLPKGCEPIAKIEYELESEVEDENELIKRLRGVESHEEASRIVKDFYSEEEANYKFEPPDELLEVEGFKQVWIDFEKHRKSIGKKLTDIACTRIWNKLLQWNHDPLLVLNNSIQNGWTGIFEPKQKNNANRKTKGDEHAEYLRS